MIFPDQWPRAKIKSTAGSEWASTESLTSTEDADATTNHVQTSSDPEDKKEDNDESDI